MKHGAIFDMDGTLFDTEKLFRRAWLELAPDFGAEPNLNFTAAISGTNLNTESENVIKRFYPNIDAAAYLARTLEVVDEWREKNLELMDGVEDILKFFRDENISMAVASSAPVAAIEANLQRANLREYFTVIVGGDLVTRGKPEPDIFLLAAEKLNLAPDDCYIFEDSLNGIRAAHASGGVAIMIPDQVQPTDDIKKICAAIFANLTEARQAIQLGNRE